MNRRESASQIISANRIFATRSRKRWESPETATQVVRNAKTYTGMKMLNSPYQCVATSTY